MLTKKEWRHKQPKQELGTKLPHKTCVKSVFQCCNSRLSACVNTALYFSSSPETPGGVALSSGLVYCCVLCDFVLFYNQANLVMVKSLQEDGHVPLLQRVQPVLAGIKLRLSSNCQAESCSSKAPRALVNPL